MLISFSLLVLLHFSSLPSNRSDGRRSRSGIPTKVSTTPVKVSNSMVKTSTSPANMQHQQTNEVDDSDSDENELNLAMQKGFPTQMVCI